MVRSSWFLLLAACATAPAPHREPLASAAEAARWQFTDPNAFRWGDDDGRGYLELHAASSYQPPHRSPLGLAILREPELDQGALRVKCKQTGREYPHRDLVIVFAYRDASHFAYAHLASQGDGSAHHVMLVDGADRRPVTTWRTAGVRWGDGWHTVEVLRIGTHVEVRFDGSAVLAGEVPAGSGKIGLGSFDDTGRFRDLEIESR
jgi:hypothetical protein